MCPRRGFTLLEVLIAMAIFSVLGLASFQLLQSVRGIDRATATQTSAYRELSRALSVLDRDFIQLRYREVRDELGDRRAAVSVNDGYYVIEITRQGWNNPLQRPRSELQRVGYLLSGDRLERHVWFVLDRAEDSEPVIQPLMEGIETFTAYLVMPDGDRKASISGDDLDELPIAIELTFSSEFWGDVTRFYDLPVFINEVVGAGDGETLDGSEGEGVQEDTGGEEGPPSPRPVTPQRPLNTSGDQL